MKDLLLLLEVILFFIPCKSKNDISLAPYNQEKVELLLVDSDNVLATVLPFNEELETFLSINNQEDVSGATNNSKGERFANGVVIVCYDCKSSSETCFGVWGTVTCKDLNCDEGCCCYD